MCGIFGFLTTDATAAERVDVKAALAAIRHRGPDDQGIFRGRSGDASFGLAFARLSILDLSPAGHQPMESADGRYVIVFNGEVFNFPELRRQLEAEGVRFRSTGDTEVVLEAWARWGEAVIPKLRGMYAFAVLDKREGRLVLVRDRLGVKPVYWARMPGGFAFASEMRALLAAGVVRRKLSRTGVEGYLAFGSVPDPHTILEDAHALQPGFRITSTGGDVRVERYWQIPMGSGPDTPRSYEEAVGGVRAELRDAIRVRLVSDVPLGVFLSGGIDSSAIISLAAELSNQPLRTFTITLDEARLDEARYAGEVAARFGCRHTAVPLSATRAAAEIDEAVRALDQPSADGLNTYFVAKATKAAGITVALSGLGGDEVFAGYPMFRNVAPLLRGLRMASPLTRLLPLGEAEGAAGRLSSRMRKAVALLSSGGDVRGAYAVIRGLFTPVQRRALLSDRTTVDAATLVDTPPGFDTALASGRLDLVNAYSALELSNYMRHTLLRDADVMSMANALEVRVPLIDHMVVERAAQVPGEMKLSRELNKPLLVDAVPTMPRAAFAREKQGFSLPFDSWFRGSLRGWMQDRLLGAGAGLGGVLRPSGVESMWRSYLEGERYVSHSRVWALAALADWCANNRVEA